MTAIPSRSVLDDYLPAYARERGRGPAKRVRLDDIAEVVERVRYIRRHLPRGGRTRALDALAEEYGVSRRTLERYETGAEVRIIEVDGWKALFLIRPGTSPQQWTWWERAT